MTEAELRAINDECDADDLAFQEEEDEAVIAAAEKTVAAEKAQAAATRAKAPAPSPTPTAPAAPPPAPKPKLGLGKDNIFRWTDDQMRDPDFCFRTQAERVKASSLEVVK
jgi:hypothetical protein